MAQVKARRRHCVVRQCIIAYSTLETTCMRKLISLLTMLVAIEANAQEHFLVGYGTVKGVVNDLRFSADYESRVDKRTGKGTVVITGVPEAIGPGMSAWTVLNLTGVCLLGAKEEGEGVNFQALTDGEYSRDLSIQMPDGHNLNTSASFATQEDGRIKVDIVYEGTVPSLEGMRAMPSEHTIIQGPKGVAHLAGEMKVKYPNRDSIVAAPIMSSFKFGSGNTLPEPMQLVLTPVKNVYDPVTKTITIEVQETIKPKGE